MAIEMTADKVRALFAYDPSSGLLRWNVRPASDFPSTRVAKIWNTRFAGRDAHAAYVNAKRQLHEGCTI